MINLKNIEQLVSEYIAKNFNEPVFEEQQVEHEEIKFFGLMTSVDVDEIDFLKLYAKAKTGCETFSEMLLRFISESGEKNSDVYNRAQIDRRHFSKIVTNKNYRASKQTVLAFAIALKLGFEQTKNLLAVAGFTLSNSNLADVIVSFFIEYEIFDVDLVNQILHKYGQTLLGDVKNF